VRFPGVARNHAASGWLLASGDVGVNLVDACPDFFVPERIGIFAIAGIGHGRSADAGKGRLLVRRSWRCARNAQDRLARGEP
jgi:hypothetical protein